MAWSPRTVARRCALVALPVLVVLTSSPASATPASWPEPEPMSTLSAIAIFVGIPAALSAVIALLTSAPSLAKGPRYRPDLPWYAEPEHFGTLPAARTSEATAVETAPSSAIDAQGGGAHGRW
ncbi:MAG: hypothetical protein M3419_05020 [Actinomycetota bacterium]|nr:hypothetical protein [Actinomycetota bacterium]